MCTIIVINEIDEEKASVGVKISNFEKSQFFTSQWPNDRLCNMVVKMWNVGSFGPGSPLLLYDFYQVI